MTTLFGSERKLAMRGSRRSYISHCISIICIIIFFTMSMALGEHEVWDCPNCGRTGNKGNYCGSCAHPAPWMDGNTGNQLHEEFRKVGNIVKYGHYEQDNNLNNGLEVIEWIVLDVQEGKSLLISKYGLDTKPYNTSYTDITWENCSLRKWLNNDFLRTAFTEEEQSAILFTVVHNSKDQGQSGYADGGNNTADQIFSLSYHEAALYFNSNESRACDPTKYAKAQGAFTSQNQLSQDYGRTRWWLRSPGITLSFATSVMEYGIIGGNIVTGAGHSVRPALWINPDLAVF